MLFLFSNNNFDKYAKEELENIFTPETRVLCFSGSDIRWQIDNKKGERKYSKWKIKINFILMI